MKAMLLERIAPVETGRDPLTIREIPVPTPGEGQVLVQISVCGVCHTELDEIEGRTPPPNLPVIPGHQVVGRVKAYGPGAGSLPLDTRVGVAWIHSACGQCPACRSGYENLCAHFQATGRDIDGGYAEWMVVGENFAHPLPAGLSDAEIAPLLCAGAVGYRALRLANLADGQALGLTGFGASAHLVCQLARWQYSNLRVYVFARSQTERDFALELGASWAGDIRESPPEPLDAVIDTTPAWLPILESLQHLRPGGRLVINAIRKEDMDRDCLLGLDYARHLWQEKEIKSIANVTRTDVREFLSLAAHIPIHPEYKEYPLEDANQALWELKQRQIRGAKVLRIQGE